MVRKKSELNIAAGKLISTVQKEWGIELGEPESALSENVMYSAHDLLQSDTLEKTRELLGSRTVSQYLGEEWVKNHPNVLPAIIRLEQALGLSPSEK